MRTNVLIFRAPPGAEETYWLGQALGSPWKLTEACSLGGGAIVSEGTFVVRFQLYQFVRLDGTRRVYERSHENQYPAVLRSLICVGNQNHVVFEDCNSRGANGEYVLSALTHAAIEKYGNWEEGWVDHDD